MAAGVNLVVVGSVALDTVETPKTRRTDLLGGAASYACAAASFFSQTGMVGVVGTDFPEEFKKIYNRFGINLDGLQICEGKTFRWAGQYSGEDLNDRRTLSTELNVFETFSPELPDTYKNVPFLFLANISPDLQLHVLDQIKNPRFVVADTMDLWINTTRKSLDKLIGRVDMLMVNESEARHLTGETFLLKAAKGLLAMGPKYIMIKRGEYGSTLFSKEKIFLLPAYPLEEIKDTTGAGDTFAGAFMGSLARGQKVDWNAIRKAMVYANVVASFVVEEFSVEKLAKISLSDIEKRVDRYKEIVQF